jgi:2-pyrone-4,6-dicarboxylate lactonase
MASQSRRPLGPEPTTAPPDPKPTRPSVSLPPLACDSHFHIFGPVNKFPYAPNRTFTPPDAPKEALLRLHEFLGFERGVFIQSACHGTDHGAVLDALALSPGRYKAVALLAADTSAAEIAHLNDAGFCGVRFHFARHLGDLPRVENLWKIIRLVEPYGWHVAVHGFAPELMAVLDFITSIPGKVVIDHIGRVDAREGANGVAFGTFQRLLDRGNIWIKLSGTDRVSKEAPPFRDAVALARILATHAPERVLWGTDWPHPNVRIMPNDGMLVDLIAEITPDERVRRRMLVDNPAEFFRFE